MHDRHDPPLDFVTVASTPSPGPTIPSARGAGCWTGNFGQPVSRIVTLTGAASPVTPHTCW
jgi:hypothetical protein